MTDPIKVRFPCKHGQHFRHMVDPKRPGRPVWCDEGEWKMMRRPDWFDGSVSSVLDRTWVEEVVDD